jgi:polygalacturonase
MRRFPLAAALLLAFVQIVDPLAVRARAESKAQPSTDDPWTRLPGILAKIRPPAFPARDFRITDFGAVGDGKTDVSAALRAAIDACHVAGGGRVVVPPGDFLTGPIRLLSNVNLHVSGGATLRFSTDPSRYLPVVLTRWEGVELMNYSPLVYALDAENIAVTGAGTLDGQADAARWWPWKSKSGPESQTPDRDRLFRQAEEGVPVGQRIYGAGHYLRPSFLEPYRCRNVLIEGVTIRNAPFWVIHPVLSTNVTVRNVTVVSLGPNNDGCDPESSSDVLIENTLFDTGDDCIAIKSGRNADGRRLAVPAERIVVRGCRMRAGHGGVTVGSEISGGVRDVFAEHNTMSSPNLERGLRIKTNHRRGGIVENVFMRDTDIGDVGTAIDVEMTYMAADETAGPSFTPVVRDVRVERMTVRKANLALSIVGLPDSPVRGLVVRNSTFRDVAKPNRLVNAGTPSLVEVVVEPSASKRP